MCQTAPGPRCAADTADRHDQTAAAYCEKYPNGPQVDSLTNTQAHYEATERPKQAPVPQVNLASLRDYGFADPSTPRLDPDDAIMNDEATQFELWQYALSNEQLEGLQDYTANDYDIVNGALKRGVFDELPDDYQQLVHRMDEAFAMAPTVDEPRMLYRGVRVPDTWDPASIGANLAEAYPPGTSLTFGAYLSTSLRPSVATSFSRGPGLVVFEMRSRSGINVQSLSDLPEEREVLLGRGSQWRVVDVTQEGTAAIENEDGEQAQASVVIVHLIEEADAHDAPIGTAAGLAPLRSDFAIPRGG